MMPLRGRAVLSAGVFFDEIILQTFEQSVRLVITHNSPGLITYKAEYKNHKDKSKSKETLPGIQFSYMYETYQRQVTAQRMQVDAAIDDVIYATTGKHLCQISSAEAVAFGLVAGTVIGIGSAAVAWALLTVGSIVPVGYSATIGSATTGGATIIPFVIQEFAKAA